MADVIRIVLVVLFLLLFALKPKAVGLAVFCGIGAILSSGELQIGVPVLDYAARVAGVACLFVGTALISWQMLFRRP